MEDDGARRLLSDVAEVDEEAAVDFFLTVRVVAWARWLLTAVAWMMGIKTSSSLKSESTMWS